MKQKIRKVLIANRGEIALRIIRTCKEMGLKTVAIYSEADRTSRHVREADEAYPIGSPSPLESYLSMEKILRVAKLSRSDALHPGYGFLSENPEFARKVKSKGLVFLGPTAPSISAMGDKIRARAIMERAGVPVVPGSHAPVKSRSAAERLARRIGYPILVKAVGGGGGKGMRIVEREEELGRSIQGATKEASSAFGDPRIYLEKYLPGPRHIEVQIIADQHGNVVHLGERECSIQRRFQKIIEESPSCYLDDQLREKVTSAAVAAGRACRYVSAGTVEFMMDENKNFYFLEMNTRIQVEHPVTEMRTGLDIVEEQIRIGMGEQIRWKQEQIQPRGHAIESRIYAEDPENDFMPSVGQLVHVRHSQGNGVRVDSALEEETEITYFYDPLISKLICWGNDREQAIRRMERALKEYVIIGVKTTIPFCLFVMRHPKFRKGTYDTHFGERFFSKEKLLTLRNENELAAVISTVLVKEFEGRNAASTVRADGTGAWSGWKSKRLEEFLLQR